MQNFHKITNSGAAIQQLVANIFATVRFALNASVSEISTKNCILSNVLFLAMSAVLVRGQGHRTHF